MNNLETINNQIKDLESKLMTLDSQKTEVYSRIVGYYRSVANWNKGKSQEYKVRRTFNHLEPSPNRTIKKNVEEPTFSPCEVDSYLFFFRTTCPNCPPMKEVLLKTSLKGSSFNVDTPEGLEKAEYFNIFTAPTVILLNKKGEELIRSSNPSKMADLLESDRISA